jgi:hypothetical protein
LEKEKGALKEQKCTLKIKNNNYFGTKFKYYKIKYLETDGVADRVPADECILPLYEDPFRSKSSSHILRSRLYLDLQKNNIKIYIFNRFTIKI